MTPGRWVGHPPCRICKCSRADHIDDLPDAPCSNCMDCTFYVPVERPNPSRVTEQRRRRWFARRRRRWCTRHTH